MEKYANLLMLFLLLIGVIFKNPLSKRDSIGWTLRLKLVILADFNDFYSCTKSCFYYTRWPKPYYIKIFITSYLA